MVGKPKPFKRPSIELGQHGRTWQTVAAKELHPGDIVRDRGLILDSTFTPPYIFVDYLNRATDMFSPDEAVYAFTKRAEESND